MFHDIYENFQQHTLDNGLSVYVKEWPNANWFYAGFVIHAGANEDLPKREGLAHLVEHLVGENIDGLTFSQLKKRIEALGGWGGFGTTSYQATTYTFHFPNEEQKIQEALHIFGHMLLTGQLTEKIEEEKAVIVREYHQRYSHELAREWALRGRPHLFKQHPRLGSFSCVYGIPDQFMQATQQEIQNFYDTYYVPHNLSLICIGPIAKPTLLQMLQETPFSVAKSGQRNALPPPFSPQPPRKHEQIIHLSEVSPLAVSNAACTFEWVIPSQFSRYCIRIASEMLEHVLLEELRYKQLLTYQVDVNYEYYQDCWTLQIELEVAPEMLAVTQELLWNTLRSTRQLQERFQDEKKAILDCIYRMDYSGYDLLVATMNDLENHHRLIPFLEEIQELKQVTCEQVLKLIAYLVHRQVK